MSPMRVSDQRGSTYTRHDVSSELYDEALSEWRLLRIHSAPRLPTVARAAAGSV